jgi:hypothetical protein
MGPTIPVVMSRPSQTPQKALPTPIHATDDQRRYVLRPTTIWTTTTGRTNRVSMSSTPADARVNEAPTMSATPATPA